MKYIILFSIYLCCSCQNHIEEKSTSTDMAKKDNVNNVPLIFQNESPQQEAKTEQSNNFELSFEGFALRIDTFNVYNEKDVLHDLLEKDSVEISVDLGSYIEGKTLHIIQNTFEKVRAYHKFETSISILDEGAHCDLLDWKHFYSEWEEITIKERQINIPRYSEKEKSQFISITLAELQKIVQQECVEKFVNNIQGIKTPFEYPSDVGISRIFLKFELEHHTGQIQERIVIFELAMGC